MLHTLSTRLLLTHLLVAVVALGLVGALTMSLFRYYYVEQTQSALVRAAEDLASSVARVMNDPDGAEKITLITRAASRSVDGRVCVFAGEQARLLASSESRRSTEPHAGRAAPACDPAATARIDDTQVLCYPGPVISVAAPITDPKTGERAGVLLMRRPLHEVEHTLRLAWYLFALSGGVAAALALLLAALVSGAIARPLGDMARTAARFAEGDFEARAERRGPLELRTVASSLNHMAAALSRAFSELSGERQRLTDILASMEEGVLSVDRRACVTLANAGARRLLGRDPDSLECIPLAELLPEEDLLEGVAQMLAGTTQRCSTVLQDGERTLRVSAARVDTPEGGAVLLVTDVTEAERLERLRREFVANASHELRTPLTSVEGFLGALADGTADTEEERLRCIRIAREQAQSMRRLVDQLLDLSRLQAGVLPFDYEEVDLPQLVAAAIDALSPQAAQRGVCLALNAGDGGDAAAIAEADGDRVMQVVMNLLANALRFSPAGSRVEVDVEAGDGDGPLTVTVRDHGSGIAEADLPLIWDRFHKADKARQRTDSGAGLGLAIAREIVVAHGGEVSAANAPDGGAVFGFTLPRRQPAESQRDGESCP